MLHWVAPVTKEHISTALLTVIVSHFARRSRIKPNHGGLPVY